MKTVFLEFKDELDAFLVWCKGSGHSPAEQKIIALDPGVQVHLKKLGLPFETTAPYFTNDSHKKIVLANKVCSDRVSRIFSHKDGIGLSETYLTETQFYLSFYINHVYRIAEIVLNLCERYPDAEFLAAVSGVCSDSLMIGGKDRFAGRIVHMIASLKGIIFEDLFEGKRQGLTGKKMSPESRISSFIPGVLSWMVRNYRKLFRKKAVIVPGRSYGFDRLLNRIRSNVRNIIFITPLPEDKSRGLVRQFLMVLSGIWTGHIYLPLLDGKDSAADMKIDEQLQGLIHEKGLFSFRGIDLVPVLRDKILGPLSVHLASLGGSSLALKKMIEDFKIKLVISPHSRGIWYAAGELSRIMGFRSLFISHGAHPVPVDVVHEAELIELCKGFMLGPYTHIALSTPVQEKHLGYFKKKYAGIKNETIKTGPLVFAALQEDRKSAKSALGIDVGKFVFTYAATTKFRGAERFYFLETEDEYLLSLGEIIKAVDKTPGAFLVIRVHPGYSMSDPELRGLLPDSKNFMINRTGPFSGVLAATDTLISYSSTAMDEALINGIPVIEYDRWKRYNHYGARKFEVNAPMSGPVIYITDDKELPRLFEKLVGDNGQMLVKADYSAYAYGKGEKFDSLFDFIMASA